MAYNIGYSEFERKMSNDQILRQLHICAALYNSHLDKRYLFASVSLNGSMIISEVVFKKRSFQHLVAIKSKLGAELFYDKCLKYNSECDEALTVEECNSSYGHGRQDIIIKSVALPTLLKFSNPKDFKIGIQDKNTLYVNFDLGYGNRATLGFIRDGNNSYLVPNTLLPQGISNYCTNTKPISFILTDFDGEKYTTIYYEAKKNLVKDLSETYDVIKEYYSENIDV